MLLVIYCIVFGGFLCLLPLTIYCLVLASVNHRRQPTMISGVADFAAALGALSGFLILGGPVVLVGLNSVWRRNVFRGSFPAVGDMLEPQWAWWTLWALYFAFVVGGSLWMFRSRRRSSVICNFAPAKAPAVLKAVADRLDLALAIRGKRTLIGPPTGPSVLELRPAPILRSVTLEWHADPGDLRTGIEAELRQILQDVDAPTNPVGAWLTVVATVLFVVQVVALALLILFLYYARN